jgi:ubiquinone biosynthesis protein
MAKKKSPISELIPTRLLDPSERPPIPDAETQWGRFRFFYVVFHFLRYSLGNSWLHLRGKKHAQKREDRTINTLKRLGMLWIRVAEALTLRGETLCTSLGLRVMDLRDSGGAYDFDKIKKVIENELQRPLERVFDQFEEKPFAATKLFQLHRAHLREEQQWTAVKIQHPGAEGIFDKDLKLFRRFIGLLKFFGIQKGMRWDELFHELKDIKVRELNYYYEAAALETLEKNLKTQPVHVPRLFRDYCKQRVLVMEFIPGALLSDLMALRRSDPQRAETWLKENNINMSTLAIRIFHSTYRQVFEDNFFHGDMNTSNIILLRDSQIAVIECRSAGSLEMESLGKQKVFLKSLLEGEYVTAAEIYFLLASRLPHVDLNTVKDKLVRIWRVWETRVHVKNLPYQQKSLAFMTGQVNRVVHDSHFAPLWSFVKLTCTWVHLDNIVAALAPELNYLKQLKIYFKRADQRENLDKLQHLPSRIAGSMAALHQVPKRTAEYTIFKEALLRRQAQVVQGSASKLDAVIASGFGFICFLMLVIGGFLLMVFGMRHLHISMQPFLGYQLNWLASHIPSMSVGIWLLFFTAYGFLYGFFRRQKTHFSRCEYGGPDTGSVLDN